MRLSTSNSNDRLPATSYLRFWLVTVGLTVLILGSWEMFWRARGFTPMPNDDVGGWCRQRQRLATVDPKSVVMVGSSRMQLGFDTQVFAQATGAHPIQLAIDGDIGIDVLEDLANDQGFRGTVICELMEKNLLLIGPGHSAGLADQWLQEYHSSNLFDRFEWKVSAALQRAFVFRMVDLSAQNLAANLRFRRLPPAPYLMVRDDRFKPADFSRTDPSLLRARFEADVTAEYGWMAAVSPAEFVSRGRPLADWVSRIRSRGGRVIFVRFPTSGVIRQVEFAKFPKAAYWDNLVAAYDLRAVHFADYESLNAFTCPDGAHLDQRDAARFTAALAEILLQKKLLSDDANR